MFSESFRSRRDTCPLVCAGLWTKLAGPLSCTVLTTTPVGGYATVHDRMLLLLPRDRWAARLDPCTDPDWVWSLAM